MGRNFPNAVENWNWYTSKIGRIVDIVNSNDEKVNLIYNWNFRNVEFDGLDMSQMKTFGSIKMRSKTWLPWTLYSQNILNSNWVQGYARNDWAISEICRFVIFYNSDPNRRYDCWCSYQAHVTLQLPFNWRQSSGSIWIAHYLVC